jgi:AraC-like DNA-binding protein
MMRTTNISFSKIARGSRRHLHNFAQPQSTHRVSPYSPKTGLHLAREDAAMRTISRREIPESPFVWTRGIASRETLRYLDRKRIDAAPLLAKAGLSRGQLSQGDRGVSIASQYRLLELAATETNDPLLGFHLAAEMDLRDAGVLFYLAASSATVSEAVENLARYAGTMSEVVLFETARDKDETVLAVRVVRAGDEPRRQFSEFTALAVLRVLRKQTNRDFVLARITFAHARNSGLREVRRLLRGPVEFAQATDSWVFPQSVMQLPIVSEDSHLLRILEAHADDLLAQRHSATGLRSMVENHLLTVLPSGRVQAAVVAEQLGMSLRSFTRYLAEEGTTFGQILDHLRKRLALRYLEDQRISWIRESTANRSETRRPTEDVVAF